MTLALAGAICSTAGRHAALHHVHLRAVAAQLFGDPDVAHRPAWPRLRLPLLLEGVLPRH